MGEHTDFWREQSKTFDEAADYYDRYRPGYPEELADCMVRETGIVKGSRILEIGAGSGKATELFAGKGYEILCIEPGENLAEAGRRKFSHTNDVSFHVSRFEEWEEKKGYFDLAISAQAFHWVPKPAGFEKCASALKPGGYIGLFWNLYLHNGSPADNQLSKLNIAPFYTAEGCKQRIRQHVEEIKTSGYFKAPAVFEFPWKCTYNAEEYVGFARTGNAYLSLGAEERNRLDEKIRDIVGQNGGVIERPYLCVLFLAQKR